MANGSRWSLLNVCFLAGTLILVAVFVPLEIIHGKGLRLHLAVCVIMVFLIGTAVTAGYHRLFSHRAYQAWWPLRLLLLVFGAAAFENSALKWASDHRLHHRYVDSDRDPYCIQKGFWYAHWTWVMEKQDHPLQGVADLERDPLVRWQHRHHFLIGAIVASLPLGAGLMTHNLWGSFVIGILLRIVCTHHLTFLINSAAHTFGTRPYTDANTARDNLLLAPLTFGEGYHNFHHMWPSDYRNGIRWHHLDTTKWLLNVLSWVGLARKLHRVPNATIERARISMTEKNMRTRLVKASPGLAEQLCSRLASARQRLDEALAGFQAQRDDWNSHRSERKAARRQYRDELHAAWEEWKAVCFQVRLVV
jgi:stearoyl-CoA desaturase (Delta-9 desaturase)